MGGSAVRVAGAVVAAAMLALSGCYIFSPSQAQENKLQTALHFDVSQCQQTAPNLYKCPGVDKSDLRGILRGAAGRLRVAGQGRQRDRHEAVALSSESRNLAAMNNKFHCGKSLVIFDSHSRPIN